MEKAKGNRKRTVSPDEYAKLLKQAKRMAPGCRQTQNHFIAHGMANRLFGNIAKGHQKCRGQEIER